MNARMTYSGSRDMLLASSIIAASTIVGASIVFSTALICRTIYNISIGVTD